MSDARDILGVNAPQALSQAQKAANLVSSMSKVNMVQRRESTGYKKGNRELAGLRSREEWEKDESVLTVVPTAPMFKKKMKKKKVNWRMERISSSARKVITGKETDELELYHWVKVHNLPDYRFARVNKKTRMLLYTDEEYISLCQDPNWSRQETDYLFELCAQYDLRFIVILDRFKTDGKYPGTTRTTEDLKHRFYHIQKLLLQARNTSDPDIQSHNLFRHIYDPAAETERKEQLRRLYNRKEEQVAAMAELVLENRELNAAIKKLQKDQRKTEKKNKKEQAAYIAAQRAAAAQNVAAAADEEGLFAMSPSSRKKGLKRRLSEMASSPAIAPGLMADIPADCIADMKALAPARKTGVTLRSTRAMLPLALTGQAVKFLDTELMNVGYKNKMKALKVPTEQVVNKFDELQGDIVTLINLRRHLKTIQQRAHVQKKNLS